MRILVVVDMQSFFKASHSKGLVKRVVNRIHRHTECGDRILLVQCDGYGVTYPEIIEAAQCNPYFDEQTCIIHKQLDSGASEVMEVARKMDVPKPLKFVVCGVNTDACVLDTARGLLALDEKSTVVLPVWCCACQADRKREKNKGIHASALLIEVFCKDWQGRATRIWGADEIG